MATIICELDHRKAARVALSTVRLWMEFILSIVSFYAHRKMSTVCFHVLKYHLIVNHTNLKMIMIVINFSFVRDQNTPVGSSFLFFNSHTVLVFFTNS